MGKGGAQTTRMEEILRYSHLDARIRRCVLMNVIVPKLGKAGKGWKRQREVRKTQLETVQITATKKILGCSKNDELYIIRNTTGNVLSLATNRYLRKSERQYGVGRMSRKKLPAITDGAVWEKTTKGETGIRRISEVEKILNDIGGDRK